MMRSIQRPARAATATSALLLGAALAAALPAPARAAGPDRLKEWQTEYSNRPDQKTARVYHFGSQGPGDVYSNHASHSNRLIPVYLFGKKPDLSAYMGENSPYRDPEKVRALFGRVPPNTVNPRAEYADQSDLYRVQKAAVEKGVKHLFIVWFDGMDWHPTRAAAVAKTGSVYTEGKGHGLIFQDYAPEGATQFGFVVTSPTHAKARTNVDAQTVAIPKDSLGGGYDVEIAGPNPWTTGPLFAQAPGYLKGQAGNKADIEGVEAARRLRHAYTDSAQSAAEMIGGVKSYNSSVNVDEHGHIGTTLFRELQGRGWKVGTVTSVPFDHVSPAAMYARNVSREDYQDLARDMLGLPGILQEARQAPLSPGLDVVMGAGYGEDNHEKKMLSQGKNWAPGNKYITAEDLKAVDVKHGGKYVVVHTRDGQNGGEALAEAAREAARGSQRLFGFFGRKGLGHLPFQTADGRYDPAPDPARKGKKPSAEAYTAADRVEQPTLAQMTNAALTVLADRPERPFALFIEAGDVDFGLHANNLDNAIGAVYSGEKAVKAVIDWVEAHSNWDESMLLVSADHGHYLVVDDLKALAGARNGGETR